MEDKSPHNPAEDWQLKLAAFATKVLVISCIAGYVNGLFKLVTGDFLGAVIWIIGASFAFAVTVVALLILAQR